MWNQTAAEDRLGVLARGILMHVRGQVQAIPGSEESPCGRRYEVDCGVARGVYWGAVVLGMIGNFTVTPTSR